MIPFVSDPPNFQIFIPELDRIFSASSEDGEQRIGDAHGVFLASGLVFLDGLFESLLASHMNPGTERFFLMRACGLFLFAFSCGGIALRFVVPLALSDCACLRLPCSLNIHVHV